MYNTCANHAAYLLYGRALIRPNIKIMRLICEFN